MRKAEGEDCNEGLIGAREEEMESEDSSEKVERILSGLSWGCGENSARGLETAI